MAASIGSISLPIFTEYNGERIELGTVEIPIHVSLERPVSKREIGTADIRIFKR